MPQSPSTFDSETEFHVTRSGAINEYSRIENFLCGLMAHFLGAEPEPTAIIFYRINNARSRNTMIEQLMTRRYGDTYSKFWSGYKGQPGIIKFLRKADQGRNEIVHWTHGQLGSELSINGDNDPQPVLVHPTFWIDQTKTPQTLSLKGLEEYSENARFVWRTLLKFWLFVTEKGTYVRSPRETWRDIFSQPIPDPLPDTHPLSLSYKAHQTPPEPSQG